jgi:threonine aldolase
VQPIDLRSDTVTLPTPAMREAMYRAELGDDVMGEDPTINRLEALAAERLGKEAGLFVVSGTMGNLVSMLTHCRRGEEAIMGDRAHTFLYEAGGASALGSIVIHTVPNLPNGMMDPAAVEAAIRDPNNPHHPRTRLICLENTHNRCGGVVLSPAQMATIGAVAKRYGLATHLDGARIFNAAVALGIPASEIAAQVDSVQFCFSKGLAAPVGSAIVGSKAFIAEARRNRKLVGGAMRQGGVLAAAAIVALEQMVERLAEDHENARVLAKGLAEIPAFDVDLATVQSDIVIWAIKPTAKTTPAEVVKRLAARGVKMGAISPTQFRAVTHYGISAADIQAALAAVRQVMGDLA